MYVSFLNTYDLALLFLHACMLCFHRHNRRGRRGHPQGCGGCGRQSGAGVEGCPGVRPLADQGRGDSQQPFEVSDQHTAPEDRARHDRTRPLPSRDGGGKAQEQQRMQAGPAGLSPARLKAVVVFPVPPLRFKKTKDFINFPTF